MPTRQSHAVRINDTRVQAEQRTINSGPPELKVYSSRFSAKKWRIAVIDDSLCQLTELSFIVREIDGCSVTSFRCADEFTLAALEDSFDLVIIDYLMPTTTGIEFTARMRLRPSLSTVPVVMLTSSSDPTTKWNAMSAGVSSFETKPIDVCEFKHKISRMLRHL